jgi:hypothetical protein
MSDFTDDRRGLWRIAGILAIVHVVLMLAGLSLGKVATVGSKPNAYVAAYIDGPLAERLAGACLACASFLVFLLAATLFARLLRGRSELGNWWASTVAASGAIYVAITLAVALPGVAAAVYDGHHGASVAMVTALSDLHYFATFASMAVLGVFTVALAAAGRVSGALARWAAYPGYAVGMLCLAAVPGAGVGLVDDAMLVWMIWFIVTGVAALRNARSASVQVRAAAAAVS